MTTIPAPVGLPARAAWAMKRVPSAEVSFRSVEPAEPPAIGALGGRESLSTHMGPPGGVIDLLVVLAQQILAVVVAVRRADHRVDVLTRGRIVVERHPALVIELDQDDRAVDAIVEDAVLLDAADPGEARLGQVARDLVASHLGVARTDAADVGVEQPAEETLLAARQLVVPDAGRLQLEIVAERGREDLPRQLGRQHGLR